MSLSIALMGVISGVSGESIVLFHKSFLSLVPTLRGLLVGCVLSDSLSRYKEDNIVPTN
jgi:hypothetical protein